MIISRIYFLVVDANKDVKDMKLVFEKMAELFQVNKVIDCQESNKENYEVDLTKEISENENKENLNIQIKSSKRFSEVSEKEVRKRTCLMSTE